jgi:hypothetical protein
MFIPFDWVRSAGFSPDSTRIASGSDGDTTGDAQWADLTMFYPASLLAPQQRTWCVLLRGIGADVEFCFRHLDCMVIRALFSHTHFIIMSIFFLFPVAVGLITFLYMLLRRAVRFLRVTLVSDVSCNMFALIPSYMRMGIVHGLVGHPWSDFYPICSDHSVVRPSPTVLVDILYKCLLMK